MKFATVFFALASALTVSAQTPPSAANEYIFLTSPIATTIYTAGKNNKITWKYNAKAGPSPPQNVNIDLLQNLNMVVGIANNVAADAGTFTWATPAALNSSMLYTIRLIDTSTTVTPPYASYSHTFEIDGAGGKATDSVLSASAPPSGAGAAAATASLPSNAPSGASLAKSNSTSSPTAAANLPSGANSTASGAASANSTTAATKANGAATKSGGNCLVALGVFAAAIAML